MHTNTVIESQKITASIPKSLLYTAQDITGLGITDTIRYGLEEIAHKKAYADMLELAGSYKFPMSVSDLREDTE